jgi:[ribosomal protein S5]-alanine N-acetyltransferase
MKFIIETERLYLRKINIQDAAAMYALDSSALVHKYLGNNPVKSLDETHTAINFIQHQYQQHGIARWAVIEKQTNNFIGWAGLKYITEPINNNVHYYDIGYRLNENYWGKGFATEAAKAALKYGFEQLQLTSIFAITDCGNNASKNVLLKCGLTITSTFLLNEVPHYWFEIHQT